MTRTLPWEITQENKGNASTKLRAIRRHSPNLHSDVDVDAPRTQIHVKLKEAPASASISSIPQE